MVDTTVDHEYLHRDICSPPAIPATAAQSAFLDFPAPGIFAYVIEVLAPKYIFGLFLNVLIVSNVS